MSQLFSKGTTIGLSLQCCFQSFEFLFVGLASQNHLYEMFNKIFLGIISIQLFNGSLTLLGRLISLSDRLLIVAFARGVYSSLLEKATHIVKTLHVLGSTNCQWHQEYSIV